MVGGFVVIFNFFSFAIYRGSITPFLCLKAKDKNLEIWNHLKTKIEGIINKMELKKIILKIIGKLFCSYNLLSFMALLLTFYVEFKNY